VAEDFELQRSSYEELAARDFAIAAFGHGPPITANASAVFSAALANGLIA
jgi:hypothetical protein